MRTSPFPCSRAGVLQRWRLLLLLWGASLALFAVGQLQGWFSAQPLQVLPDSANCGELMFSHDGSVLIARRRPAGEFLIWDLGTGKLRNSYPSASFVAPERIPLIDVLLLTDYGRVFFDPEIRPQGPLLEPKVNEVSVISPNGLYEATYSHRATEVTVHETHTGKKRHRIDLLLVGASKSESYFIYFSRDSRFLMAGNKETGLFAWDLTSGKQSRSCVPRATCRWDILALGEDRLLVWERTTPPGPLNERLLLFIPEKEEPIELPEDLAHRIRGGPSGQRLHLSADGRVLTFAAITSSRLQKIRYSVLGFRYRKWFPFHSHSDIVFLNLEDRVIQATIAERESFAVSPDETILVTSPSTNNRMEVWLYPKGASRRWLWGVAVFLIPLVATMILVGNTVFRREKKN